MGELLSWVTLAGATTLHPNRVCRVFDQLQTSLTSGSKPTPSGHTPSIELGSRVLQGSA
ncbi:MAG: hypothetical protein QXM80_03510 [Thermofilaceae archaeon]